MVDTSQTLIFANLAAADSWAAANPNAAVPGRLCRTQAEGMAYMRTPAGWTPVIQAPVGWFGSVGQSADRDIGVNQQTRLTSLTIPVECPNGMYAISYFCRLRIDGNFNYRIIGTGMFNDGISTANSEWITKEHLGVVRKTDTAVTVTLDAQCDGGAIRVVGAIRAWWISP